MKFPEIKIKSLNNLKTLPLIGALAISLALWPTLSMADKGDRGGHKNKYSHDDRQSHSKGRNSHNNKRHYKSRGNSHKSNHGYSSKHRYNKGYGAHKNHAHYKRDHHGGHRAHNHTTYVVNDRHYSDYSYGLDPLRFMIGLHTNNVDIIFRD